MKIAFWSPMRGHSGTTSNILATTLVFGSQIRRKIILTQTHFQQNNLESPLIGSNVIDAKTSEYFQDVGLDALIRNFKAEKLSIENLDNCCISLPNTSINLLPGTIKNNRDSFDYEMDVVIINLFRTIEQLKDIVWIDISAGINPISLKIMADADLTIVNLNQNIGMLDDFFHKHRKILPEKLFYLIGNYDSNSKYNIHNLRRRYPKEIKQKNSGIIPYNTFYRDAICEGKVIEFIVNNIHSQRNDENQYFINKVKNTTDKIIKYAGICLGKEERII